MAVAARLFQVPGPTGAPGTPGVNGTNGANAYSELTDTFVMPAEGADVQVEMTSTEWAVPRQGTVEGMLVQVEFAGVLEVRSVDNDVVVTLRNVAVAASDIYPDNATAGAVIPIGARVTPTGMQGPEGPATAGALLAANNLSDLADPLTAIGNLGLGGVATRDAGVANGEIPPINDAAGITAGEAIFATASGIESKTAASARTALGLDSMATQAAGAVAITGGSVAGITDLAVADGGTGGSTAATARSNLGLTRAVGDALLYLHQLASGNNAGDFTSGSWQTVPLNTEVYDTGNHGSIAGNTVTLAQGVYRIRWRVCGFQVANFQSRLFNVTTAGVIGYGSNASSAAADAVMDYSIGEARLTVAAATEQVRLEAQCQTTNTGDGFGVANSFGATETYASLELVKEAG